MHQNTFIIIPAFNEEKHIAQVIESLLERNYKIVIVDDCSSDNTFNIAKTFSITVLKHAINLGQGAALATGTEFALQQGADVIVHFDGDAQFLAEEIKNVVEPILEDQIDIVLGSRFNTNKTQIRTQNNTNMQIPFFKKYIILPIARIINHFLTGVKLTDAHCGFRAMNRNTAQKISIFQNRMSHNTEIVSQIKKYNLKYKEIPITVIYHEFGQGIDGGFKILKELLIKKFI